IDLSQQQPGYQKIDDIARKILDLIVARGGFIPVTDKSDPEVIYRIFGISKKNYKKAIGALYKARLIALETDGVRLTEA
ncbi:MAG TPA: GntR family transcriptional regulator, partial [Calditrichia bacterium]|nr:GntR family transcriptional regulator [Calditrichia bacterium]